MPRLGTPLTDIAVRNAKASPQKARTLYDTGGLMLLIQPSGSKSWALKYRHEGRERRMGLGAYPTISLAEARKKRDEHRAAIISEGIDPQVQRRLDRRKSEQDGLSFDKIAGRWLEMMSKGWAPATITKNTHHLSDLLVSLGKLPVATITPQDVLEALKLIEDQGKIHSAHRSRQVASQIFQFAIANGWTNQDPAASLRRALTPVRTKSHAAPTDLKVLSAILSAIDGYSGHRSTHLALRLLPLVFTRSTELRGARWEEFDLITGDWRIPAERMKMRRAHLVPLSRQAIAILQEAQALNNGEGLVFPGVRSRKKGLSENTFNAALRYLGFSKDDITAHGFRAVASTQLNEMGWDPDVIERQMAHADRNKVRAIYNRNEYVQERRNMMQAWADRVEALKAGDVQQILAKAVPRGAKKP